MPLTALGIIPGISKQDVQFIITVLSMVETENLPYSKNNLKSNWKGALGIKCPWHVRSFNGMCQK